EITDHITLCFEPNAELADTLRDFGSYIAAQVLADAIAEGIPAGAEEVETLDIDGLEVKLTISKA
ncbi:MAG: hypothetical protein K2L16_06300, partial [Muribaculaceae bacterium]|nr:hypothetical protein [Muribaculaceae bacterium]